MKPFLLLFSLLTLCSCSYFLEQQIEREEIENYVSPYRGLWVGKYTGDESGDLSITVAKNGYTSVTRTSQFGTENSAYSGIVRDDSALQGVTLDSGFTLFGNLSAKSGTWVMGKNKGTWSLTKK